MISITCLKKKFRLFLVRLVIWSKKLKISVYISNKNHFNAGVLLINMHEWRKQEIERKCFDLLKTHAPILHDQDLLNYLINDPVLLNTTWNFTSFYYVLGYDESTHDFSLIPPSFGSSLTKKILGQCYFLWDP